MGNNGYSIALIGAGQLGSRHLQGLARIDIPVAITVVDPSGDSLEVARKRFEEIPANSNIARIDFSTSMADLPASADLCIVATNADVRAGVIRDAVVRGAVNRVILEKVLFQDINDYKEISELFRHHGVLAYVNCPRRVYPFYLAMKELLTNRRRLMFEVAGSHWNMASNAIHLLDLFAFLAGGDRIEITEALLDREVMASKRAGYIEFTGSIGGTIMPDHRFRICALKEAGHAETITIENEEVKIVVTESERKALVAWGGSGAPPEEKQVDCPFQSQLTADVARDLLLNDRCGLTRYEESERLHVPMLKAFLAHLASLDGHERTTCPIT